MCVGQSKEAHQTFVVQLLYNDNGTDVFLLGTYFVDDGLFVKIKSIRTVWKVGNDWNC